MRAMILAAGRGERMGELTHDLPKPLLRLGNQYLIEYAILSLIQANIREIVINISYHAEKIKTALGDGKRYGADFFYSEEVERLETGGGILKALPLLGDQPFLVMSSDIVTDYPLQTLPSSPEGLAHLVMVDNPVFHPQGDFGLRNNKIDQTALPAFTFGNIGVYHPRLFEHCEPGYFPLNRLLAPAILAGHVTGEHYQGIWYNVGTPQDLIIAKNLVTKQ